MTRWMIVGWLSRRRRPSLAAPEPRDPALLQEARDAARVARERLQEVHARDAEVTRESERSERIHRRNNLGPAMLRALEGR